MLQENSPAIRNIVRNKDKLFMLLIFGFTMRNITVQTHPPDPFRSKGRGNKSLP